MQVNMHALKILIDLHLCDSYYNYVTHLRLGSLSDLFNQESIILAIVHINTFNLPASICT